MSVYLKPNKRYSLPAILQGVYNQLDYNYRNGFSTYTGIDSKLIDFMAEVFPDSGNDVALGQFPKNSTRITQLELCLFTSQSATTVITAGQALANITETTYTSYARQMMATGTWGAAQAGTGGVGTRQTVYPQVSFPAVGVTGATINGFFIGYDGTTAAGGSGTPTICICQANFDDALAAVLTTNDVLKLTPYIQYNA